MSIIKTLSRDLLIDPTELNKLVSSAPYRYKKYQIPKRNGKGYRDIAQPSKELKFVQRATLSNIEWLNQLPVHASAKAYKKKTNIKENVLVHREGAYLLKMDFQSFFPSIKPRDFIKHIKKYTNSSLTEEDEITISRLFFYIQFRGFPLVLSIGSPVSPFISNTLMFDFDEEVHTYCTKNAIAYTRYADDLSFSTNVKGALYDVPSMIGSLLEKLTYPTLVINTSKTVFLSKRGNRHITGLVISNDGTVSIGRKKKRHIKSLVYQHMKGALPDTQLLYLKGYLSFCKGVDREFIYTLEKKYGKDAIDIIRHL